MGRTTRAREGCRILLTLSILSQAVTAGSTGQPLQFVGTVGVEDQVVDQAEFEALEDDFSSDGSYGEDGDAGQVVLAGSEGTTAEVGFLDAGPTFVDGLDVLAVGFVRQSPGSTPAPCGSPYSAVICRDLQRYASEPLPI